MRAQGGHGQHEQFWIVICPESRVEGGIWRKWYQGGYVAVGWPPPGKSMEDDEPGYSFENDRRSKDPTWSGVRNCLHEMKVGDKIIPFLMYWRIAPVGTIRALHVKDSEWCPTVDALQYVVGHDDESHFSTVPDLGRRIDVTWQVEHMPTEGKIAVVPSHQYSPIARNAVQKPYKGRYSSSNLVAFLSDPKRWVILDGQ